MDRESIFLSNPSTLLHHTVLYLSIFVQVEASRSRNECDDYDGKRYDAEAEHIHATRLFHGCMLHLIRNRAHTDMDNTDGK